MSYNASKCYDCILSKANQIFKKNIFIKDIAIWNRRVTGMVFLPGFRAVASLQGPKERSRNGIISLIGEY